ncbi:MAG: hypothetical protein JNL58_13250 [Planctomyces sp.]|nr:hypothetical protein [Planctomyces sp.]
MFSEIGWHRKQAAIGMALLSPFQKLLILLIQSQAPQPDSFSGVEQKANNIGRIAGAETAADGELNRVIEFLGLPFFFKQFHGEWWKPSVGSSTAAAVTADHLSKSGTTASFDRKALLNGL